MNICRATVTVRTCSPSLREAGTKKETSAQAPFRRIPAGQMENRFVTHHVETDTASRIVYGSALENLVEFRFLFSASSHK
jgi:hypothetical protein